jgi:hypothetical protein
LNFLVGAATIMNKLLIPLEALVDDCFFDVDSKPF